MPVARPLPRLSESAPLEPDIDVADRGRALPGCTGSSLAQPVYSIGSVGLEVVVMERRGICLVVLLGGGACVGSQVNEHAVVLERDDLPENQTQEGEICEGW